MREFECIAREDGRAILGVRVGANGGALPRVEGYQISAIRNLEFGTLMDRRIGGTGWDAISKWLCRWVKMEWE
jgi:hypothetical protein